MGRYPALPACGGSKASNRIGTANVRPWRPEFYNRGVFSLRPARVLAFAFLACGTSLYAQSSSAEAREPGRVVLVLPFDNRSGNPALNWIGDSFPDTLNQRLNSSGFLTLSRDDRDYALDHLGLPVGFRPTRASTLRIAQTLDADYVIVGSYNIKDAPGAAPATAGQPMNLQSRIQVQVQVLEVNKLHLSPPLADSSELARLFDIENAIAWKVARQIEPHFAVAEQTFLSASGSVRLSAFESYIRGTDATAPAERVKRLEAAVRDSPKYPAAQLALGKQLYLDRNYHEAAAVLAKVDPSDRLALEASFYRGLALFNETKYVDASAAFGFVAARLPLPEVVNDQGVAESRQLKDASALFLQASNADPKDPDYHFNLAVALFRRGDFAGAGAQIDQTLKLKPTDTEATQVRALISAGRSTSSQPADFQPTTRLRRTYSEAGFRQAAFQMDQMRAARLATLPPAQQASEYNTLGEGYLAQGLVPEAEEQFQAAITANPNNAGAHAGLAQVRERSGSADQARTEAQTALRLGPNARAHLVLARLDLAANQLPDAATEVRAVLRLEPNNATALGLRQSLQARGQALPQ